MQPLKPLVLFFSHVLAIDLCDPNEAFKLQIDGESDFHITLGDRTVLTHPFLFAGDGITDYREFHGDFFQDDYVAFKRPLENFQILNSTQLAATSEYDFAVLLDGFMQVSFTCS